MIEARECAKIKKHIKGHYNRIESSTSFGFPDIAVSLNGKTKLVEAKVIHGKREPYFWLEKTQKIWHYNHSEHNCSAVFLFFGPDYMSLLEGRWVISGEMTWVATKAKWKVPFGQFQYVERRFTKPYKWKVFNEVLYGN